MSDLKHLNLTQLNERKKSCLMYIDNLKRNLGNQETLLNWINKYSEDLAEKKPIEECVTSPGPVQYLPGSPVGKNKEHVERMAKAHAAYVCEIMELVVTGDKWCPTKIMEIIESQYRTAFIHGYRHGVEDTGLN